MCTTILETTSLAGSAKGPDGWFRLEQANVGYDHPFHADLEHALTIDFVRESALDKRVAVELTIESAKELAATILAAVEQAEAYEAR
jgi:hypothetical protein